RAQIERGGRDLNSYTPIDERDRPAWFAARRRWEEFKNYFRRTAVIEKQASTEAETRITEQTKEQATRREATRARDDRAASRILAADAGAKNLNVEERVPWRERVMKRTSAFLPVGSPSPVIPEATRRAAPPSLLAGAAARAPRVARALR